jgi:hypothetical protein
MLYLRLILSVGKLYIGLYRAAFKLILTDNPTFERCLEEDESATHVLCDCEAIAYLRFRYLGQIFMEPSDYYDGPVN